MKNKKLLLYILLLISFTQIIHSQVPTYVPTSGLVGYWSFNGNANDASGNGNNGTVNGATLTTDRNGNANSAYSFDGNNDYIESICSNLPLGNSSRSISAWVNMPGLNYVNTNFITSWGYGDASQTSANKAFGFLTALNGMWLWQSFSDSQNNEYFSTTFSPNNYYHVVVTVDNNGLFKFFVNSVLVYTNQIIGMNTISNGGVLRIGRSTHTNTDGWAGYFLGKIDDLAIYNRELTPQEISNLYNSSLPQTTCLPAYVPANGLVGYWPFCGNVNDESGNGNNGTVNGATLTTDRNGNANSAYSFDGLNDFIICNNNNMPTQSMTISAWVYQQDSFANAEYICLGSASSTKWGLIASNNNINLNYGRGCSGSGGSNLTNSPINLGEWNHLVYVSSGVGGTTQIYKNGVFIGQTTANTVGSCSTQNLYFGVDIFSIPEYINGKLDDIGIWNRALTQQEITNLYNSCTSAAPTAAASQTFCTAATVADLTATGTDVKWYATATDFTVLAPSTTLTSGTYYVSQTINGCESTRTTVTVAVNDAQITASATTVCSGTTVTITASANSANTAGSNTLPTNLQNGLVGYWPFNGNANDASGNGNNGTVNGATLTTDRFGNSNGAYSFDGVDDFISIGALNNLSTFSSSFWFNCSNSENVSYPIGLGINYNNTVDVYKGYGVALSPNAEICGIAPNRVLLSDSITTCGNIVQSNVPFTNNNWYNVVVISDGNSGKIYLNGNFVGYSNSINVLGILDLVFGKRSDNFAYFTGIIDDVTIYNRALTSQEIQQLYTPVLTYLWSTGETTATINPTPTATTTYWCDITANGVTCRKELAITVNPTTAPTAAANQTFCTAATVNNLTATGTDVRWYATATDFTVLAPSTTLTSGTYYASQTINGCESTRTAVAVAVNDAQITASATTVCSGTAVTITASSNTVSANNTLPTNLQNGLVGYWPFNGNANDASGNGNNGTVNGATLTTDRFGNSNGAYSFDGIDSYITQNNTPNILTSNYSISIWFNSPISLCSNNVMLRSGDASNCGWQGFSIGPAGPNNFGLIDLGNNNYAFVPNYNCNNISINEWHNLVYTRQNMYSKQYIDGILVSSNSSSHYDVASNCPIFFGSNHLDQNGNSWNVFNGKLDDIAIYNRALSSSEIQQLYIQEQTTYLWSTGETTSTINPTPTATTTYWCEITANGLTCRKEITITVNPNTAPSAAATQTFCTAATVANLTATGTDVKWYASANESIALLPSTTLTSGTYYASQTINGCESNRTAVAVAVNDAQITASATTVCSGTAVTIAALANSANSAGSNTLPTNLQNGLVGYWPFNGNANDFSGNGNNGTVNGATLTADRFGNSNGAYSFDNLSDVISLTNISPSLNNFSKTISVWLKFPNQYQYSSLAVVKNGTAYSTGFDLAIDQNNSAYGANNYLVVFLAGNGGAITFISNQSELGNWANLIATYNGSEIKLYLNGNLKASQPFSENLNCTDSNIYFGLWDNPSAPDAVSRQLDDIAIYNRALSPQEITQLYTQGQTTYLWSTGDITATINPTPSETTTYWCDITANGVTCRKEITITVNPNTAPSAAATQTFCTAATFANLTATGTDVKWYATANESIALLPSTTLTSGTYYASQTINGCESIRTAVAVVVNYAQITASASSICSGTSVNLAVNNSPITISNQIGTVSNSIGYGWTQNFSVIQGNVYKVTVNGAFSMGTVCPAYERDAAYWNLGYNNNEPVNDICNYGWFIQNYCNLRPYNDTYNPSHSYDYYITANSPTLTVGFYDCCYGDNCGNISFTISEVNTLYLWSTGETTSTINPTPTATTTYWCDITANGLTCRKEITITVNPTTAPTAAANQTFCTAATVANLTATGTDVKWFATATDFTVLAPSTTLTSGTYYASQTINGCESTRTEVTVAVNDAQITASATTVCSGTAVTIAASANSANTAGSNTLPTNLQNGLVGYWPFNGNANDESGNGNNGTVNGATLTTDRFGNSNSAYSFNGMSRISASDQALPINSESRTVMFWMNNHFSNYAYALPFEYGTHSPSNSIWFNHIQNEPFGRPQGSVLVDFYNIGMLTNSIVPFNQWVQVGITYNSTSQELKFYLNGQNTDNSSIQMNTISNILSIGAATINFDDAFLGEIDDFSVWNRPLSHAEIQQLYTQGQPTYLWSTGETTASINPTPTATSTYWCDITANGVTCRKEITITIPKIISHPSNANLCATVGASTTISVQDNIPNANYTWQFRVVTATNLNPTWTNISSSNAGSVYSNYTTATLTLTKTTTLPAIGTQYRVVVSGDCGISVSNPANITIISTIKAGTIVSAATVCLGGNITLTLSAFTGTSFQWQSAPITTTTAPGVFTDIPGATNPSYTITSATADMNKSYRVVVANSCYGTTAISPIKTIKVDPTSVGGTVKGGGTVCSLGGGTLSLSGNVGKIQWQYSTDGGATYVNAPSATVGTSSNFTTTSASSIAATYLVANVSSNTLFRALVTSGVCSSSASNAVEFVLGTQAVAGTISAQASTICAASGTTLTLSGNLGSIVWQKSTNWTAATPTWTAVTTSVTPTLSTGALAATTAFRAKVTIGLCSTVYTDATVITVSPAAKGGTVALNVAGTDVCSGSSKAMKVTGNVGTIQWQMSTTSATAGFVDVAGATTTPYTFTNITQPTWFRVVARSGVCTTTSASNAIGITVSTTPAVAGTISGVNSVCTATGSTLSLAGSTGTIVWQKAIAPFTTWGTVAGATTGSLATGNLTATSAYRAILTSGTCKAITDAYTVTVSPAARATAISGNALIKTLATAICTSATATLTLATGSIGTIEWQYYYAGSSATSVTNTSVVTWTPIVGATSAVYNASSDQPGNVWFRIKFTSGPCSLNAFSTPVNVWFKNCNIAKIETQDELVKTPFEVVAYPNPYSENFNLSLTTSSEDKVGVMVYDMTGKLIEQHDVRLSEVSALHVGDRYPSGVYNVIVTQGLEFKTLRVVKR